MYDHFFWLHPIICNLILRQVQALEQAYDYWEKFRFDIIASKVSWVWSVPISRCVSNASSFRCLTLGHQSDGQQSTVPANGRRFTQDECHFKANPIYSRTHGTPNTAAQWTR